MRIHDIPIRDPYVVPAPKEGLYYLFGSTDANIWGKGIGFDYYVSRDLSTWDGPTPAFRPDRNFWSEENFWAPEVHPYQGRYYLLATFKPKHNGHRGTAVLVADALGGPYRPYSAGPVTPKNWDALDGTLYVDNGGTPWMIFCHEWTQVQDGEICLMPLSSDLHHAQGPATLLFSGSAAPWSTPKKNTRFGEGEAFVTDGPYIHRDPDGTLVMLWSSFRQEQYALGMAISDSGEIHGPWRHRSLPLWDQDGGHGMTFQGFDGVPYLILHQPNQTPHERARLFTLWGTAASMTLRSVG